MATTVSFEVYSLREGHWNLDSVYDHREQALHEARDLLDRRNRRAVKVIRENYDDDTEITVSRTIFTEDRGVDKPKPRRHKPGPSLRSAAARKKKNGDSDFVRYVVILVLSVGGPTTDCLLNNCECQSARW